MGGGTSAAGVMITSPSILMKTSPLAPPEQEWEWAIEGIRAVGEHAATMGIDIVLEAWNRYETYFNKTLADAVKIWEATGLTNGGAMGDLFHMNMEEKSLSGAIRETGPLLRHMHLCDSTRAAPGEGEIDFQAVMDALVDIDYQGWLSMETDPVVGNPLDVIKAGVGPEWVRPVRKAINRLVQEPRALAESLRLRPRGISAATHRQGDDLAGPQDFGQTIRSHDVHSKMGEDPTMTRDLTRRRHRFLRLLALLCAFALIAAACGDDERRRDAS